MNETPLSPRTTEASSRYAHLDEMTPGELLRAMNEEDHKVADAVGAAIPQIEALLRASVERLSRGGRVFYLGAGTSGRLGIVDASEIPPTYGVRDKFIGLIAGGDRAIRNAVEHAEDDPAQGWKDMAPFSPTADDTVIGIAASGTTPYVVGVCREARSHGLLTGCITCNAESPLADAVEYPVVTVVGPEFVTGSTRLKSATAEKLILNMLSTSAMVLLGHVRGNRMVDMQLTNTKLIDRGTRMILEETALQDYDQARALLLRHGSVREAVEAFRQSKK